MSNGAENSWGIHYQSFQVHFAEKNACEMFADELMLVFCPRKINSTFLEKLCLTHIKKHQK